MVGSFFTMLFSKIAAVVQWFADLFVSIFVALWDIFRDMFSWVFEEALTVVSSALGALDLSGINANLNYGSIPANVMLVMSCIGLGQALSIITAALVIRFTLQLIPFVRLGS
jgi:hypothetical protein